MAIADSCVMQSLMIADISDVASMVGMPPHMVVTAIISVAIRTIIVIITIIAIKIGQPSVGWAEDFKVSRAAAHW